MAYWVAGHISGGLGNRLFQHAAAMGLAEKWGHKVVFYLPLAAPTEHGPFENIFRLFPETTVITEDEKHILVAEPFGHVFTYTAFPESHINANIVLDGWRQSPKYFPSTGVHAELEKTIFEGRRLGLLQKYNLESGTTRQSTCFVHIRLGDYKVLPHHQIDIGAYIAKASKEFPEKTRFLVFSDEAIQYKAMLEGLVRAVGHEPIIVEETDELENLFLMSQCWGGAIVANSTFSWWGAYFARQRCPTPERFKAFYPEVWGIGLPPAKDILPSWGITIKN